MWQTYGSVPACIVLFLSILCSPFSLRAIDNSVSAGDVLYLLLFWVQLPSSVSPLTIDLKSVLKG